MFVKFAACRSAHPQAYLLPLVQLPQRLVGIAIAPLPCFTPGSFNWAQRGRLFFPGLEANPLLQGLVGSHDVCAALSLILHGLLRLQCNPLSSIFTRPLGHKLPSRSEVLLGAQQDGSPLPRAGQACRRLQGGGPRERAGVWRPRPELRSCCGEAEAEFVSRHPLARLPLSAHGKWGKGFPRLSSGNPSSDVISLS